jgi:hypothetical protein
MITANRMERARLDLPMPGKADTLAGIAGRLPMRRVLLMLDITEDEAEHIVEALVPVSPESRDAGIKEAFKDARSQAPQDCRAVTLQIRSKASMALGGSAAGVAMQEASAL